MPFVRPTRGELVDRTSADIATRLGIGPFLRRSVLGAIATAHAGSAHTMHGHLAWAARQISLETADDEQLDRRAATWGIFRKPAKFATGTATFSGGVGSVVPNRLRLRRSDGRDFETNGAATIGPLGTVSAEVRCRTAGVVGNSPTDTELAIVATQAGVASPAIVEAPGLEGGTDSESDDDLRARLVARIRTPPKAGHESDYVRWALEVPGITRAWAFKNWWGPGSVGISVASDDDPTGPIATEDKVEEVRVYLEQLRPVTADLVVFTPAALPVDLTVRISPDTEAVRAAVEQSLADLLRREGSPGARLYLSHLREAVSTSAGEIDSEVFEPAADIVPGVGQLPTLGAVVFA